MTKTPPVPWLTIAIALICLAQSVQAELLPDQPQSSQDISLADALDTPGWIWEGMDNGQGPPLAVEDPTARGGAKVVLPVWASISTEVPGEGIIRIRFNGYTPQVRLNGEVIFEILLPDDPEVADTDDQIAAVVVPPGGGTLRISTYQQIEIDYVKLILPPPSIVATLGLPDTLSSGGTAMWVPSPSQRLGKYVASLVVNESGQEGWFEFPITGPAEVAISHKSNYSSGEIELLVDGRQAWTSSRHEELITIEIPEGTHTFRCVGWMNAYSTTYYLEITGMNVTPLATGGKLGSAMDYPAVWASKGGWQLSSDPMQDEVDALQPLVPPEPPYPSYESEHVLRTAVSGPGTVRFMTYLLDTPQSSYQSPIVWVSDIHPYIFRRFNDEPQGWQEHTLWYPPGEHLIQWEVRGTETRITGLAIDQYRFEASETLAFDAVVGEVDGTWENDPERPWSGIRREPGGDTFVISPFIGPNEPTSISLAVQGPGTVHFHWSNGAKEDTDGEVWINGVKQPTELPHTVDGEMVILAVPQEGELTLEWKFTARFEKNWAEIRNVEWIPWEEVSLTEALDVPKEVTWETSAELPFKGYPDTSAINGSSAQVGLLPGEETWLEATVTGSGLFDFWFRGVPGALNDPRDLEWELFIDGVKSYITPNSSTWPAQWVLGAGVHKIRLLFRNNTETEGKAYLAVDDVSWKPLIPAHGGEGWTASHPDLVDGFSNGGLDDGPQHVLPVATGELRWIEKTVTGPGVLEWTSRVAQGRSANFSPQVLIDGICPLPLEKMWEWETKRLHIPDGVHTVRWIATPGSSSEEDPYPTLTDAIWQLGNVTFKPGVSPLMLGIDDEELFWFAVGSSAGNAVVGGNSFDGVDAWELGEDTVLHLCNIATRGIKAWGMVSLSNGSGTEPLWAQIMRWVGPGDSVEWIATRRNRSVTYPQPCIVDRFTMKQFEIIPMDVALDSDQAFDAYNWTGLADADNAYDGTDVAWSYRPSSYGTSTVSMTLQGPAKMRFRWKASSPGSLGLRVDGAWLPVAAPNTDWREVEFDVYQPALIEWIHKASPGTNYAAPAEAWLDSVTIEALPPRTLSALATDGSGLVIERTEGATEADQWRGVAYRDASGTWREGVRGITGASGLQTTVTGPVLLSFRSYCGGVSIPLPTEDTMSPQSVVVIGNPAYYITQRFLSVKVDDTIKLQAFPEEGDGWTDYLVHIPEGTHRVVWQLDGIRNFANPSEKMEEWQAWVGDVTLLSPQAHYESWADLFLLEHSAREPAEDADGDGANNYLEYAYGFDPADELSKPAAMFGKLRSYNSSVMDEPPLQRIALYVPRLSSHVTAELQVSEDFETWTSSPIPLRSYRVERDFIWDINYPPQDVDSGIYQVILFDITPDQPAKYFRIKF